MNPFEEGFVTNRAQALEVLQTCELDVKEFEHVTDAELIRFANTIIREHNEL